jgi:hypothetical protein
VLADASESMTVADEPGGQTRWERLRESLTAAEGEAGEMLADGHHAIRVWRFDRGVDAVEVSAGSPFPLGAWEKRAGSGETRPSGSHSTMRCVRPPARPLPACCC